MRRISKGKVGGLILPRFTAAPLTHTSLLVSAAAFPPSIPSQLVDNDCGQESRVLHGVKLFSKRDNIVMLDHALREVRKARSGLHQVKVTRRLSSTAGGLKRIWRGSLFLKLIF